MLMVIIHRLASGLFNMAGAIQDAGTPSAADKAAGIRVRPWGQQKNTADPERFFRKS